MRSIMRGLLRATLSFGVVAVVIASVAPIEAAQNVPAKKRTPDGTKDRVFAIPKEITLTTEQQSKLDQIKKEQAPKIVELTTKRAAVLTEQQKTARKDAIAKAKADGMTGKARTTAINDAVQLTEEQKKLQEEIKPQLTKLRQTVKEQIHGLLTDDQKAYYKLPKSKKTA